MNRIWTLGYGILEHTHEERKVAFQERLGIISRGIGKPITLVDIRKEGSGSRNGIWFRQYVTKRKNQHNHSGMYALVAELDCNIAYWREPALANNFGQTKCQLELYENSLEASLILADDLGKERAEAFYRVADHANTRVRAVVLMCGCKQAFKKNGTTWNCHRVPLANALVEILGNGWSICHL